MRSKVIPSLATVSLLVLIFIVTAQARTASQEDPVNWYYATAFGTGIYQYGDSHVLAINLPFSRLLSEPRDADSDWGMRLLLPVTLGYQYDSLSGIPDYLFPDNISTVSFMPGLEWQRQFTRDWRIEPYLQAGVGHEIGGDLGAWIYNAGIRSRYTLTRDEHWLLGNKLFYAGYDTVQDSRDTYSGLVTGLAYSRPAVMTLFNRDTGIGLQLNLYYYFDELNFHPQLGNLLQVSQELEFAATLDWLRPLSLFGFPVDRLGLGIRYGDSLSGIRLVTSHPY